jgi:hypothetical protein
MNISNYNFKQEEKSLYERVKILRDSYFKNIKIDVRFTENLDSYSVLEFYLDKYNVWKELILLQKYRKPTRINYRFSGVCQGSMFMARDLNAKSNEDKLLLWEDFTLLIERRVCEGKGKIHIIKAECDCKEITNDTLFYLTNDGNLIIDGKCIDHIDLTINWSYDH